MAKKLKAIGIIPARYESKRFSGKVLAELLGKPVIQHVWERAKKSTLLDDLLVAADDEQIIRAVSSFGGKAVLTDKKHASGTDRINEAAQSLQADIIINIQADEPLLESPMIDDLISALSNDPHIVMATLRKKITDFEEINDPNVVKVAADNKGYALYFSRRLIPFYYDACPEKIYYKHIGLYAYTKKFLNVFTHLPASPLEMAERLEQLRTLENGYNIKVLETKYDTIAVDTFHDLEKVRAKLLDLKK